MRRLHTQSRLLLLSETHPILAFSFHFHFSLFNHGRPVNLLRLLRLHVHNGTAVKFIACSRCLSIFRRERFMYRGDLLVCDNVLSLPIDCILVWDFLIANCLQIAVFGDSYYLVGPHGAPLLTPISQPGKPPAPSFSGFPASASPGHNAESMQSSDNCPVFVRVRSDISTPSRSECVIQANIPKVVLI